MNLEDLSIEQLAQRRDEVTALNDLIPLRHVQAIIVSIEQYSEAATRHPFRQI